jgi:hypothetical protein
LYEKALARLGGADSGLHSQVLAQLAVELVLTPEREGQDERHALQVGSFRANDRANPPL